VIVCRSAVELERMREAGRLVGEVLTTLSAQVAPAQASALELASRAPPLPSSFSGARKGC